MSVVRERAVIATKTPLNSDLVALIGLRFAPPEILSGGRIDITGLNHLLRGTSFCGHIAHTFSTILTSGLNSTRVLDNPGIQPYLYTHWTSLLVRKLARRAAYLPLSLRALVSVGKSHALDII